MKNDSLLVILHITLSFTFTIESSRYDYLFFENLELSKECFIKEQNLKLTISRRNLYDSIAALTSGIHEISQHHSDSHSSGLNGNGKWLHLEMINIRSHLDATAIIPLDTDKLIYNHTMREWENGMHFQILKTFIITPTKYVMSPYTLPLYIKY